MPLPLTVYGDFMKDLMLYFHIPFCLSKCSYCAFFSKPECSDGLKKDYVNALIKQIQSFSDAEDYNVCSVYFGGGTPTVLDAAQLCLLLSSVKQRFCLAENAEITVEANPKTVDYEELCALRKAGFNRISLGAQSFNDNTLLLLGRAHNSDDFIECYNNARRAGFTNINADLIFALPEESVSDFEYSLKKLIELKPEHISVYNLGLEEGTKLYNEQESFRFPTEDEEEQQYNILCSQMAAAGYSHYEISNFATIGYESRHNNGYWRRIPYFGFGAGAHSFYHGKRFYSEDDISAFIEKAALGYLEPTNYSTAAFVTDAEAEEERIMLGLRLAEGIALESFDLPAYLFSDGYIKKDGQRIALTEKGFRLSNRIISMLI